MITMNREMKKTNLNANEIQRSLELLFILGYDTSKIVERVKEYNSKINVETVEGIIEYMFIRGGYDGPEQLVKVISSTSKTKIHTNMTMLRTSLRSVLTDTYAFIVGSIHGKSFPNAKIIAIDMIHAYTLEGSLSAFNYLTYRTNINTPSGITYTDDKVKAHKISNWAINNLNSYTEHSKIIILRDIEFLLRTTQEFDCQDKLFVETLLNESVATQPVYVIFKNNTYVHMYHGHDGWVVSVDSVNEVPPVLDIFNSMVGSMTALEKASFGRHNLRPSYYEKNTKSFSFRVSNEHLLYVVLRSLYL